MKSVSMKVMTGVLAVAMMMGMTTGVFASELTAGDIADAYDDDSGSIQSGYENYNVYEPTAGDPVTAGKASSVVVVDAEATTFKVTVPIALHVHQDTEGVKTYADAMNAENATGTAKIINECSMGQVKITDVKVVAAEGYTISAWDADYNNMKVNSKTFGFKINGVETQTNGTVVTSNAVTDTITTTVKNNEDSKTDLTRVYGDYNITPSGDSAFPVIAHASVLPIDYEAKLPAYSAAVTDTNVGAVVFTVDFN
ncbi:hypothetical protein [Flavonifractor sp. An91]|uniref:hypothetical protein n=1 Tax=Flavonifractor sp. An91 TaxID=1965665 RepID=UPI000B3AB6E3|nr:hypothetical protein [Flavonifractor sp. An91]OUN13328.1 hypothetical protein B5G42_04910 [Flavonifractor sp. An91]